MAVQPPVAFYSRLNQSMVLDSAALQQKISELRPKLLDSRAKVIDLLKQQVWKSYRSAEGVINKYVDLLGGIPHQCYQNKSDLGIDLDLLKGLQDRLEQEDATAKDEYYDLRLSLLDYHRKRDMILQELYDVKDRSGISEDLLNWITRQLMGEDEGWKCRLKFADQYEEQLMRQAAEDAQTVHYLKQTIDHEPIQVDNPDIVKSRFLSCSKEVGEATRKMEENSRAYVYARPMCRSVKKLREFLEANRWLIPDDDTKAVGAFARKKAKKAKQKALGKGSKQANVPK